MLRPNFKIDAASCVMAAWHLQTCSSDAAVESALAAWASYGRPGTAPPEQLFTASRPPGPMERFLKPAAQKLTHPPVRRPILGILGAYCDLFDHENM